MNLNGELCRNNPRDRKVWECVREISIHRLPFVSIIRGSLKLDMALGEEEKSAFSRMVLYLLNGKF